MATVNERRHGSRTRTGVRSPVPDSISGLQSTPHDEAALSASEVAAFKVKSHRIWIGYAVLGALLLAYLISLLVRNADQSWPWLDGWALTSMELVAVGMCLYRGFERRPGRAIPLILGFALLSWTIGDFVLTGESLGGAQRAGPVVG